MQIVIILAFVLMGLVVIVIHSAIANFRLKRHQEEWDALKEMLIAFAPSISEDALLEAYVQYIESIECYYPRF